ncbi:MAG TPA: TPM domain-containing protein [Pyrinomonadaceae bacterium]|nr:TPM domain-containing protein [Pyrinomonadaceae bacterium]
MAVSVAIAQDAPAWNQNVSPLPSPTGPVNDFTGTLDPATVQKLNTRLIEYQRSSGIELAVAVIKTTGDRAIADYALAVYRGWGIGSKGADNPGALMLVAIDDRKYFTEVGRDLEDELPDGLVGSLQRQYLVPEFRKGDYAKGISDTIEAYIKTIEERSSGSAASPTPVGGRTGETSGSQGLYSTFCCLVIIGIVLLIIFSSRGGGGKSGKDRDRWGGGGFGGGGASVLPWIIGSAIGSSSGSSSSDWGSGGGGWGGGGSDWGGFGGGGDAGGGGAGGDW